MTAAAPVRLCVCRRPLRKADTATLCPNCTTELRHQLEAQIDYRAELNTELRREVRKQPEQAGKSSGEKPLYFNPDASELLQRQLDVLTKWAATLLGHQPRPTHTVTLIRWHLQQLPRIRTLDNAHDMLTDLTHLTRAIVKTIDLPETRYHLKDVGPCPEKPRGADGYESPCPGRIEVFFPATRTCYAICKACGGEWEGGQWARLGLRISRRQAEVDRQTGLVQHFTRRTDTNRHAATQNFLSKISRGT